MVMFPLEVRISVVPIANILVLAAIEVIVVVKDIEFALVN
jgi:hypothetical protein